MTEEAKSKISDNMKKLWADPAKREQRLKKMRESFRKRRRKELKDVPSQLDDYTTYQREYQRLWRAAHPNYYKDLAKKRYNKKKDEE